MRWHEGFFRAPCFAWHPHIWLVFGVLVILALADVDRRVLVVLCLFVMALALGGCAAMRSPLEQTYQAVHLVDTLETLHGPAEDRACYFERDPVTRRLIGRHPSEAGVITWGVGLALAHAGITQVLMRHAPRWAVYGWQAFTITDAAVAVGHNWAIGIRLGMPNHPSYGCTTP